MPQQVESKVSTLRSGISCSAVGRGAGGAEGLLVAMPVQQRGPARHRGEGEVEAAGRALAVDEFLEELGVLGERLGVGAGQHRREFVAQGQQA